MFRLVTLLDQDLGMDAVAYADADAYASEPAAWGAYCASSGGFSGIGRHDSDGRLVELIVDRVLDSAESGARCDRLSRDLGVRVRTVPMALRPSNVVDVRAVRQFVTDIERDLPRRVVEPLWRRSLCQDLSTEPLGMTGVLNAVQRLSWTAVLDLFPHLSDLADELPDSIRTELRRHISDPATVAGTAALRLGL